MRSFRALVARDIASVVLFWWSWSDRAGRFDCGRWRRSALLSVFSLCAPFKSAGRYTTLQISLINLPFFLLSWRGFYASRAFDACGPQPSLVSPPPQVQLPLVRCASYALAWCIRCTSPYALKVACASASRTVGTARLDGVKARICWLVIRRL